MTRVLRYALTITAALDGCKKDEIMAGTQEAGTAKAAVATGQAHAHLEGRVTGLERDMQHTLQMVEQTNRTVTAGFEETRRMMQESDLRATGRSAEIHRRIDEQQHEVSQHGQVSWPLVMSAIVASLALGGVFVAFVNMTMSPISVDVGETRQMLSEHEALPAHPDVIDRLGREEVQLMDAHFEVEKLHRITDECQLDRREMWVSIGRLQTQVEAIQMQQDRRWPQIIRGAESRGAQDVINSQLLDRTTITPSKE